MAALLVDLLPVEESLLVEAFPDSLWNNTRGHSSIVLGSVGNHGLCKNDSHEYGTCLDLAREAACLGVAASLVRAGNRTRVESYRWAYKSAGNSLKHLHLQHRGDPCTDWSNNADTPREFFESFAQKAGTSHDRVRYDIFAKRPCLPARYSFDKYRRHHSDSNCREDNCSCIHHHERDVLLAGCLRHSLL